MAVSRSAVIRAAESDDVERLSQLAVETYVDAFGYTFGTSDLAVHLERHLSPRCFRRIIEDDVVLLAEAESHLIGYVQFGAATIPSAGSSVGSQPTDSSLGSQEVRRLYIHRAFQRQGYGRLLMDAALEHPRLRNVARIFLDVWEHNHGAQRFYRRYGFEVVGSRRFEMASGVQTDLDLVMVRYGSPGM